ncbi:MAG: response regulator [Candidatus Syntrophosphaera sp.]|jgi:DNA-binding NtrC family response regulator|nr:response regulator [Candidatus Cloacimonadota bacterium]MDD5625424.1 response regulator [Candidatus Cloacimonadota bacterium]MDY0111573.1 response regulator [Candidatus Syntrophosphaera sp.]
MITIGIVDDEEELVENLILQLKQIKPDWNIIGFSNGMDALKEIIAGNIDLVVTDIAMPDMDGYELFWRIKDYNPKIPVIMITGFGYDPNHVLVRAKSDGLQEILYKPFKTDKLIEIIDKQIKSNKIN